MKVILSSFLASAVVGYTINPIIGNAAKGMNLLKPLFKAEAELQASVLGYLSNIDKQDVLDEISELKKNNKVLIYTYSLSPFSSEAVKILDATGYEFTEVELGAEWFLLGGKESVTRVALSEELESGASSLPKVFIGGKCIGGCSELTSLAQSGELDILLSKAKAPKKGQTGKKGGMFAFFN